ncbi:MAG: LacI family DNA-binding transcriptional regulator, partial [Candidatus Promineifilaceae bacterium]
IWYRYHMVTIPYIGQIIVGMTTIHDVAKRAGVAPITVSRVINNSGYVSEGTRERVETAVLELGYVPSGPARSLRLKRTNSIALVLTDITNPFFTTIARGVEDVAGAAGYTVTYCNTDEDESKELRNISLLLQQQVDGILLVPALSKVDTVNLIEGYKVPVVVLDRRIPEVDADIVRCDSVDGAYKLVSYLLKLGHRRIAILTGPEGTSTADDRLAGYKWAMSEYGLDIGKDWIFRGTFTQDSGFDMAQRAARLNPRPSAIFAANNFIAIGAMKALQELALSVPEDISLVGFDDLPESLVVFPFLTVVAQPAYQMAQEATLLLLARIAGEAPQERQELVLPTKLIIRLSAERLPG